MKRRRRRKNPGTLDLALLGGAVLLVGGFIYWQRQRAAANVQAAASAVPGVSTTPALGAGGVGTAAGADQFPSTAATDAANALPAVGNVGNGILSSLAHIF